MFLKQANKVWIDEAGGRPHGRAQARISEQEAALHCIFNPAETLLFRHFPQEDNSDRAATTTQELCWHKFWRLSRSSGQTWKPQEQCYFRTMQGPQLCIWRGTVTGLAPT